VATRRNIAVTDIAIVAILIREYEFRLPKKKEFRQTSQVPSQATISLFVGPHDVFGSMPLCP